MNARNTRILAISVDAPEESQALSERFGVDLVFLSDRDRKVIDAYNVRHDRAITTHGFDSIAIPTNLLIDREGIIRWIWQSPNYRVRLPEDEIVAAVEAHAT